MSCYQVIHNYEALQASEAKVMAAFDTVMFMNHLYCTFQTKEFIHFNFDLLTSKSVTVLSRKLDLDCSISNNRSLWFPTFNITPLEKTDITLELRTLFIVHENVVSKRFRLCCILQCVCRYY